MFRVAWRTTPAERREKARAREILREDLVNDPQVHGVHLQAEHGVLVDNTH